MEVFDIIFLDVTKDRDMFKLFKKFNRFFVFSFII